MKQMLYGSFSVQSGSIERDRLDLRRGLVLLGGRLGGKADEGERVARELAHGLRRLVGVGPPGGSVRGERANFTRLVLGWLAGSFSAAAAVDRTIFKN